MSKIKELEERYKGKVPVLTIKKFIEGDKTLTKKYLDFLLRSWTTKETFGGFKSIDQYIRLINDFEELLPYIENKDIYSYENLSKIMVSIAEAKDIKTNKSFNRDEHIKIIKETDDFIFLIPLTHVGSLKYGSNTKWCTAANSNPSTFKNYINKGFLIYLIDKTNKIKSPYNKIAFFMDGKEKVLTSGITLYDQLDRVIQDNDLIKSGWDYNLLSELLINLRKNLMVFKEREKHINEIKMIKNHFNLIKYDDFFKLLGELNVSDEKIQVIKDSLGNVKNILKEINI